MRPANLPDLTFPMVSFGSKQVPWDLAIFLYVGGVDVRPRDFQQAAASGALGKPIPGRLPVVKCIHEELTADLVAGGSKHSTQSRIYVLRDLFSWVDQHRIRVQLRSLPKVFFDWAENLVRRSTPKGKLSPSSAYSKGAVLSSLFGKMLGLQTELVKHTRLKKGKGSTEFGTGLADRALIAETMALGKALIEVCDQLTSEALRGPLPMQISVDGKKVELWARMQKHAGPAVVAAWSADASLHRRAPNVNLRIEAEMLVFIAQTGMNLQQAIGLQTDQYSYSSHLDGYQVRQYKNRRSGEVLFEIFSEYRPHFERYLRWRSEWFGATGDLRLFPFHSPGVAEGTPPGFSRILDLCKHVGLKFVGPRALRSARINWLLREIGSVDQVAEMAQHDPATLIRNYARPNPRLAFTEIALFNKKTEQASSSPAPGMCTGGAPRPVDSAPRGAPAPDCIAAAGCLFCKQHRDVDSADHVWSLASYRHLKSLELTSYRRPVGHKDMSNPAELAVNRLTKKLQFFQGSTQQRQAWFREAQARIDEGFYHPMWDGFIQLRDWGEMP